MPNLTRNVAIAGAVFFVLTLVLRGDGFGADALMGAGFRTLIFALIYAAISVALIMFRGPKE
ncbi:MAG: hypothetical protein AB8B60_06050 [Sulfitobacter sp.]